jgi:hypothetical protein
MATVYTSVGEAVVVDLIDGTSSTHLDSTNSHIGFGTGTTGAAKGDTALETASSEDRTQATASQSAADTNQWVATITSTQTQAITEAVLFDASTSGNCIIRSVFSAINVDSDDAIQFTFTLQQA